jgi:hypothetical protein
MTPDTLIRRNPELIAADMDGETVMMDIQSGHYYGINAVGSHVWALLETEQRLDTVVAAVLEAFETQDAMNVAKDVQAFLAEMQAHKLVEMLPA